MSGVELPCGMGRAIADIVQQSGEEDVETGGFALAPMDASTGTVLALTGTKGIERNWGLFRVSGEALATLFDWADERELRVLAQWHSHKHDAFLSAVDLDGGFNVQGFHSAVIPNFASPSSDPADWGWWTFDGIGWVETQVPSSRTNDGSLWKRLLGMLQRARTRLSCPRSVSASPEFAVITFEEGSVHEH